MLLVHFSIANNGTLKDSHHSMTDRFVENQIGEAVKTGHTVEPQIQQ
jgi:hypothetical protein